MVGLGVDGNASNESGRMVGELHQAMLAARYAGGPQALSARDCLRMATMGGAPLPGPRDRNGLAGARESWLTSPYGGSTSSPGPASRTR